jgi:hypothetical protein
MTPWQYLAQCIQVAEGALRQEGENPERLYGSTEQVRLFDRDGMASRAAIALGLVNLARRAEVELSIASREDVNPAVMAESVAGAFITVTQIRMVLDGLAPGGLAEAVAQGPQAHSQRKGAAVKGGEARTRRDWHDEALQAWAQDPLASQTKVAKHVASKFNSDQSSVARSIKRLIPNTSVSFTGG